MLFEHFAGLRRLAWQGKGGMVSIADNSHAMALNSFFNVPTVLTVWR
jgi:hypothetical protein